MYLDHFGLREAPFRITPHTEFFFAGANRGATLEALIYAITHDEGIVKVTGEVGSGKTMLCRMLLEKLPGNVETAYLANPSLARDEILHAIAEELGAPLPEGRSRLLLNALHERLLDMHAAGRQVVVLIDEAHAMPPETLEEIRLLSNLETRQHKLLHIVLFGQPELDERLGETGMRQLRERITHNFSLEPLHRQDVGSYLMFRLRAAGYRGPDLFTPRAVQLISTASAGLTRRINILADKALLAAFSQDTHQIDRRQVEAAIRDARFAPMHDGQAGARTWLAGAAALLALAALGFIGSRWLDSAEPQPPPARAAAGTVDAAAPSPSLSPAQPSLAERTTAAEEWLRTGPDSRFVIEVLSGGREEIEDFLARHENPSPGFDPGRIRVLRRTTAGDEVLGIVYGDYTAREAADAELADLARALPERRLAIRPVGELR